MGRAGHQILAHQQQTVLGEELSMPCDGAFLSPMVALGACE